MRWLTHKRLWASTIFILLLLMAGSSYIVHNSWQQALHKAEVALEVEMHLLGELITHELRLGKYEYSDELIQHWGRDSPAIVSIKLVTGNGFVLSEYLRPLATSGDVISKKENLNYSYSGKAQLLIVKDLAVAKNSLLGLFYQLSFALLFIALVLVIVVRLLILHRKESLALSQSKQELARSNVNLLTEVAQREAAEQAMRQLNEKLETRVEERTTELMEARDESERANLAKSEFLSRMSHELRTPMNAILGFSQLLQQNDDNNLNESEVVYVNEVYKAGEHLLELINEVLDLSRVESGKIQLSIETVELSTLVSDCVALLSPLIEQQQLVLALPQEEEVLVSADRMRLKQVIVNLLSNAVKYNHRGGKVVVAIEPSGQQFRLSITDNGPGIPQAMHHRVFEPFDRLNADSTSIEGTGIGLSLARRLIEFMGGSMGFSSTEGEGCIFWIDIPASVAEIEPAAEAFKTTAVAWSEKQGHVLYVEDNPANLRLVRELLVRQGGVEFHDAHSVSLAMDMIYSHNFDLILVDIHLAGREDGYGILNKLRADPALRNTPVVAVSANATPREIEHGLAAGFNEYIIKPINVEHFNHIIARFLRDK